MSAPSPPTATLEPALPGEDSPSQGLPPAADLTTRRNAAAQRYGDRQRVARRQALWMLGAIVVATGAAVALFGFAVRGEPMVLRAAPYPTVQQDGDDHAEEAVGPKLGSGSEGDRSPYARLVRTLRKTNPEDERALRRILEENCVAGPQMDAHTAARLTDMLVRALDEEKRVEVRRAALALLARVPKGTLQVSPFTEPLGDADATMRAIAVLGLTRHGRDDSWKAILGLAGDPAAAVRRAVAEGVSGIRDDSVVEQLAGMLMDADDSVVAAAGESLGHCMGKVLPASFLSACGSTRPATRLAAANALSICRGDAAVPLLVGFARDADWRVRLAAIRGLSQVRNVQQELVIHTLEDLAADGAQPRSTRYEALQALAAMPTLGRPALIVAVATDDPDPVLRLMAARTGLAHRQMRVTEPLIALLRVEMGERCDHEDMVFIHATAASTLQDALGLAAQDDVETLASKARERAGTIEPAALDYSPVRIDESW